jgi:hypothetical protein
MNLLEPNALVGDLLLFTISIMFYVQIRREATNLFVTYWSRFFLIFGISFIVGGFGHVLFNYTQAAGRIPSWYLGLLTPFWIEQAMILLWPQSKTRKLLQQISIIKTVFFLLGLTAYVLVRFNSLSLTTGMIFPTYNAVIGLGSSLGILAVIYQRRFANNFKYFWYGALSFFPSAIIQGIKFNLYPWFDRNDLSHLLLIIGLFFYYKGIKSTQKATDMILSDRQKATLIENSKITYATDNNRGNN